MAILNYMIINSAATPMSKDSPNPNPEQRPTKILLPKKKAMKWSTGVAPGDYGGPPTTTKLRKYWGGQKEDPVTSSEFIWNNDFMPQMEKLVNDQSQVSDSNLPSSSAEESSGFLSLNRVMSLDSLEVDLSASLKATPKTASEQKNTTENVQVPTRRWKLAATKREQEKWDKAAKASTAGSDVLLRELRQPQGDPEVLAAQSREQYYQLKNKLQLLTVGIGGIGLVSAYVSYSPEIAASFGAGLLGSLAYIRMLGNSVDSMASSGSKKMIKAAVGQPRLLVPVALVMIYNRWNEIAVPQFGLMHLDLIPMLVGFFTYKIATFTQAIEDALPVAEKKTET
ncbi:protein CONSERVED ONLY IN THE GREEN LINEAGE 160, chloroplastic [Amaranthus tricolor]|uniref:protein CONSERVED ONLY IN THE GREEN LINEAGE 160, chloroplastic n=1 Tax=Amaranthus tricolor TaxID=29722 RepID=UPI00258772C0|nr:protein CONSERVED ONLY IN THE GREEN LINEAGE 160, chloroplastic [Amaranthus tricolor]